MDDLGRTSLPAAAASSLPATVPAGLSGDALARYMQLSPLMRAQVSHGSDRCSVRNRARFRCLPGCFVLVMATHISCM
jgi:hypothetical protein